ncbi:AbiJ-NTD4 domain-containing protein [Agrobacterium tumefaciens]|uniref:AbiJ-NTD4 domain-containing protein n=1 Tax=Agrobacterium tumefaciens TaxID=358 RepID=UPI003BA18E12
MENEFSYRKELTFEQAEGAAPLPSQLALKEISSGLKAKMWQVFHDSLVADGSNWLSGNWDIILRDHHVDRLNLPIDMFNSYKPTALQEIRGHFFNDNYLKFFGFIQYVLRHYRCPEYIKQAVPAILTMHRAAYRVVDGDTIAPFATEEEGATVQRALDELKAAGMDGARSHLRNAMINLTAGAWADSIRESIHAVESVARTIAAGTNTLGPALTEIEKKLGMRTALKSGFGSIYGFASDSRGIRHALLDKGDAEVDEADAMFMIGACSAFVTYLVQKKRAAGI